MYYQEYPPEQDHRDDEWVPMYVGNTSYFLTCIHFFCIFSSILFIPFYRIRRYNVSHQQFPVGRKVFLLENTEIKILEYILC